MRCVDAMQQTCVFSRFALEKVRVLTIDEFSRELDEFSRELNEKLLSAAVAFKNLLAFFFC